MLRSPLTANSRPRMMTTIQAGAIRSWTRETSADEISSLSAIGSNSRPNVVTCFLLRARYPSSKSVNAAARNRLAPKNAQVRISTVSNTTTTMGTRKIRAIVRAFGRFINRPRVSQNTHTGCRIPPSGIRDLKFEMVNSRFGSPGSDWNNLESTISNSWHPDFWISAVVI